MNVPDSGHGAAAQRAVSVIGDILGRSHDWERLTVQQGERFGSWHVVIDAGGWAAVVVVEATVVDVVLRDDKM